jgi:hypothetical protein
MKKSDRIRRVVSLEGDDYLSGSEIWPDKRGGLKRGFNVTTNQNYIKSTIQLNTDLQSNFFKHLANICDFKWKSF